MLNAPKAPLPESGGDAPRPASPGSRVERGRARQTILGLTLAAGIIGGWSFMHVTTLFIVPVRGAALAAIPLALALQCWLSVGLFIVAHDAMHGSLAPFRPRLNRAVGRLALLLYAGIWYDALVARHFAHHRAPGTEHDPDFAGDGGAGFWRWYTTFFLEYLSPGQCLRLASAAAIYMAVFRVAPERLLLFWALPAVLSSLQLFAFGTYLPHRPERTEFIDRHRARSSALPYLVSLATCFHFGYHHEHHANTSVPWWRLPAVRLGRSGG